MLLGLSGWCYAVHDRPSQDGGIRSCIDTEHGGSPCILIVTSLSRRPTRAVARSSHACGQALNAKRTMQSDVHALAWCSTSVPQGGVRGNLSVESCTCTVFIPRSSCIVYMDGVNSL